MASSNLAALQRTANRYASKAGFAPIAADGGMGVNTENAVRKALAWAGEPGFFTQMFADDSMVGAARGLTDEINSSSSPQTVIMQRNVDINTVLSTLAQQYGLPAAAAPTGSAMPLNPVTMNAGSSPTLPGAAGAAGSILGVFGSMPTPMKVALAGIAVGIGYFAFSTPKRRK